MTPEELRGILTLSGLSARVKGEEVLVESCIFCSNAKWNLELNAGKGVFKCWACREGGRLDTLLEKITGDRYQIRPHFNRERGQPAPRPQSIPQQQPFRALPISEVPSAATYLADRGYDVHVAREFGLTVCVEEGHELYGRIVIPIKDYWTGLTLGWTGRSYTGKRPKYLNVIDTLQITGWKAPGRVPVVIVEGHLDGIAVRRGGFSAGVLGGTGVRDIPEWAPRLHPEQWIVVMLDGDAQESAHQLYWNIAAVRGRTRLVQAQLAPEEDPAGLGPVGVQRYVFAAISSLDGTSSS